MKKVISAAVLSVGIAFGGTASADTFEMGTLGFGLHNIGPRLASPGLFQDRWNFSLANNGSDFSSAVANIELDFFSTQLLDIEGLTFNLYNDANVRLSTPGALSFAGILSDGSYHIEIEGIATGYVGGQYFGNAYVAPVPEISSLLGILIGGGIVSLAVRRRRVV